jgi:hypothetical protein
MRAGYRATRNELVKEVRFTVRLWKQRPAVSG